MVVPGNPKLALATKAAGQARTAELMMLTLTVYAQQARQMWTPCTPSQCLQLLLQEQPLIHQMPLQIS